MEEGICFGLGGGVDLPDLQQQHSNTGAGFMFNVTAGRVVDASTSACDVLQHGPQANIFLVLTAALG